MAATAHVTPRNDLIEHDTEADDASCVCGPTTVPLDINGSAAWVYVHPSLDGREALEAD
ncbi:hypothetical protein ACFYPA_06015 [Streptomyces sp. NPDC005775]|uniref:hypothetical protein n=1 Tax=Streptomyces sp. NPDC005775 TaxID=3364729 RepID=UPI00369DE2F8